MNGTIEVPVSLLHTAGWVVIALIAANAAILVITLTTTRDAAQQATTARRDIIQSERSNILTGINAGFAFHERQKNELCEINGDGDTVERDEPDSGAVS